MDDNVLLGMRVAEHLETNNGPDSRQWIGEMLSFMKLRFAGK
jgi:hypothetical protein